MGAVILRESDTLLGAVGLTPEEGADAAELSYWLSPAYWGIGITIEAARAVVAFGFESLALPIITSGCFEDKPPSGRVLRKLCFEETGRVVRPCLAAGGEALSIGVELAHLTRR